MTKCAICKQPIEVLDIQIKEGTFFKRCNSCNITHMKSPVGFLINDFSDPSLDRYLRLIVLNMINKLPIHDLYEIYICDKEAYSVLEFDEKVKAYNTKKEQK